MTIAPSTSKNLLVAVDITATALPGGSVKTNIADQTYITVDAPDIATVIHKD